LSDETLVQSEAFIDRRSCNEVDGEGGSKQNKMKTIQEYQFPFERYEIWKLSITMAKEIYTLTKEFPAEEKYGITSQIRRAINSVSANIAEGVSRFSEKEKARFIEIAFGSLMEVANFLFLSKELGYLSEDLFRDIKPQILELSNKINAFHKKLKK
jgi:four helix bundle protein